MAHVLPKPLPVPNLTLITFAVEEEARPFQWRVAHTRVLITGMGPRNAERSVREALAARSPTRVLTCGFAGGLNPDLAVGTVLFEADEGFDAASGLRAAGARPGRFHCADRVAVLATEKRALRATTGADAVEMESGVIRALCRERGIPGATVRVISDAAEDDLPLDFNLLMDPAGRIPQARVFVELLKQPWRVPRVIRLGLRTQHAARRLAAVLSEALGR
jgi:nucleoside phosphorylase